MKLLTVITFKMSDFFLPIVVAIVLVVLSSVAVLLLFYGRGSKRNAVCLLGLSNSGKTLLYMRMVHGEFAHTQTSMKENKSFIKVTNKKNKQVNIELVDIPGNDRLRERTWRQYISLLSAIVIVVDSVNFPEEKREVAHLVISALSEPLVQKRRIPVLIACNKQDVALALPEKEIETVLQEEITQILSNPSVQLDSIDQSKEQKQMKLPLSKDNQFTFSLQTTPIGVVPCSSRGRGDEQVCEAELTSVDKWLSSIA